MRPLQSVFFENSIFYRMKYFLKYFLFNPMTRRKMSISSSKRRFGQYKSGKLMNLSNLKKINRKGQLIHRR
jgi:hypothetical protein